MIITANAPLEIAAAGAVTAAFHLTGQVCTSAERFYVVDSVHDRFIELFAQRTRQLRIGHGLGRSEIGPLVSEVSHTLSLPGENDDLVTGWALATNWSSTMV